MASKPSKELLHTYLKKYFGYDGFRDQPLEIINTLLSGNDAMVVMPTGGGKSLCFQLPALLLPGVTLVISPLIALMKDQVDGLCANGIKAAFLNSNLSREEQNTLLDRIRKRDIKLMYTAPESLPAFTNILTPEYLSCVAVDEAHCISSWGHDFRPSYQKLSFLKRNLPQVPVIALTASADKATRNDIKDQLGISTARQFISSFDRSNIFLEARPSNKRLEQIITFINKHEGEAGIIYCLSRKSTEQLTLKLKNKGFNAEAYHAGQSYDERNKIQEDFIYDKIQIICATIAFGMGIDKSNIRWVIHYNLPKNLEGYYQEIGRAGRDGEVAYALLFHSYADVIQLRKFAEGTANEEIQMAKLDRIKQFAEAKGCRRKILLSYFGEYRQTDCQNCDMCKNPPEFFEGTILAQKALSVIARLKENESLTVVVDVLRGAQNNVILDKNYQNIKSYGIGKDISWRDWQQYIIQLIDQGFCEIAFHENNRLKLTEASKKVLFDNQKVFLARPLAITTKTKKSKTSENVKTSELFDTLKMLRHKIALEKKIPAYLIFSDTTLKEMEAVKPIDKDSFLLISGVGEHKMEVYGDLFMNEIRAYIKSVESSKNTFLKSLILFEEGLTPEEIAEKRNLKVTTIYSHLAKLYEKGKLNEVNSLISDSELSMVKKAFNEVGESDVLKPYYEFLDEKVPYHIIRLALSIIDKENNHKKV